MATVVPIYSESGSFIGLWAHDRDFRPSFGTLGELMSLAEPALRALTNIPHKRTDNFGVVRVGENISFQDGVFLMIDNERSPIEEVKHGGTFLAIAYHGIPIAKRTGASSHARKRRSLLHLLRKIFKRCATCAKQDAPAESTIDGASREAAASESTPGNDSTHEPPEAGVDANTLLVQYQSVDQEVSTPAFSELMRLAEGKDGRLVAPLLRAVTHEDKRVRSLAAALLGTIGDSRAGSALIPLLADASWDVRYNAVEALGKLESREAILPMIQCVSKERNFRVRGRGLHVLEHVFRCVDERIIGHVQASWRENGIDLEDREGGFD